MNKLIKNKKIFITGGAGFIATKIIESLFIENEITVFDNFERDSLSKSTVINKDSVHIINGDVLNVDQLIKAAKGSEIFIHAAAIAGIDTVANNPVKTMRVNMLGTANALEAAIKVGVTDRFINISTSEVFGKFAYKLKESDVTSFGKAGEARWTYAVSKLAGEHLSLAYYSEYGLPVVNIRPFNIYGPGQTGEGALIKFIQQAINNETIIIDGDGSQIRAWCYVDDLVDGLLLAITKPKAVGESINLGNMRATMTILGLANTVCRVLKSNSKIIHSEPLSQDIEIRVPSLEKANLILGFQPIVDLEEGIQNTVDWLKSSNTSVG
jgi:UDP-glucose 4-epimerase